MKDKKLKIVFDANPIVNPKKTGVGMYTQRLISALAENAADYEFTGYYFDFLDRKKIPDLGNPTIKRAAVNLYPGAVFNLLRRFRIEIPVEMLAKTKPDIALYSNFLSVPSLTHAKSFAVLHDLSYIDHPEYTSDKNRKDLERFVPKTIQRCAGIITVSEFSKQVIAKEYSYPLDKILVTPIPPEPIIEVTQSEKTQVLNKFEIRGDYLLFLGTLEPRKNLITLLEAYEQSSELQSKCSLVLAGGMDWKFEAIAEKIEKLKQDGLRIIQCGYVSDQERAALYAGAAVFVSPAHYEGFGMPILEAMQYGVPVAISDIPVFHEVAGDAAVYFDQNNSLDISSKLLEVLTNMTLRKQLKESSIKKLKTYDWNVIARSVIEFISK